MLRTQDTNSLSELKTQFVCQAENPDFILNTVKAFRLSSANRCFAQLKAKGFSLTSLFVSLLCFPFLGVKTINEAVNNPLVPWIEARKDTFYRMKNSSRIDWRSILWVFARQFIKVSQSTTHGLQKTPERHRCLIFDDTVLHKTGRRIENISKVWDHVSNRSVIGFKLLLGLYYDGISMLPVDFSLHRERGKKADKPYGFKKRELARIFNKSREKDSPAFTRTKEADESKPVRCRKLGYYYLRATVHLKDQPVTLFFSKQGKRGKWKIFLTTDTKLSFIEMVKIYQIRWSIEVFFKEAKQLLGLGKCQSNDFDAHIAACTLTMIQHMILTLRWRFETYETKGGLFNEDMDKVAALKIADRLWGLLIELARVIDEVFEGSVDGEALLHKAITDPKVNEMLGKLLGIENSDISQITAD